jgi:hypothetical protein
VFVVIVIVPSVARLVVSRRRLRRRHRSGVFHVILVPVQPLPAVLVASSPVPVVVVVVVLSSFPVVVAFVPPSSRPHPPPAFRLVCSSPVIVFVLGSASSSLVPAASRLHPRIAAEVVPSPSVSAAPVRRCRSLASSSGGKVSPLAAPSSFFQCRPVPVVRSSTPVPVYRCR